MSRIKINQSLVIFIVGTLIFSMGIASAISQSISVNVIETRDFKVDFISIDEKTTSFYDNVSESVKFMNVTYPLSNKGLKIGINHSVLNSDAGITLDEDDMYSLSKKVYKTGRLSGSTDRVVGIVPNGWFNTHGLPGKGVAPIGEAKFYSSPFLIINTKGIIVEEGYMHASAHEISHTLGLCDEYNVNDWNKLNETFGGCPNGDLDNDKNLDAVCLVYPSGCPTSTIGKLVPWNGSSNFIDLKNLMGSSDQPNNRWIDKPSYNRLLDVFSSTFGFLTVDYGILISGTIDKNGDVNLDDYSYVLNEQSISNESSQGNFSLIVEENGNILNTLIFQPEFLVAFIDGNITEVNVSAFSFVVPFSANVTNIVVKENNITKDQINRTPNTPSINITTNLSGQVFYNETFNVSWSSFDADGDTLAYAILFSDDNGANYSTLEIDYNQTTLILNTSTLPSCQYCKIKVLATDGINTNYSISDTFNVNNILDVSNLTQLYSNNTLRTFGFFITNLDDAVMNNVTWKVNTGLANISSQYNSTLQSGKSKYVLFEYNYTSSGNYTLTATAIGGEGSISYSESMGVNI